MKVVSVHLPFLWGFDKTLSPGQLTPYWPPYWTPYKINGKMKIKKKPRTINVTRFKFINKLAYLKLARWRTRCRFPTLVLLLLFSGGFVDGKSTTEWDWISSNSAFVRIGKWSKEKRWQMNRLVPQKPQPEDEFHKIVPGVSPSSRILRTVAALVLTFWTSPVDYFLLGAWSQNKRLINGKQ